MIEYLEESHPSPPLLPRSPPDRARVRSLALAVACDIHPLNNLRVLNYLRSQLGQDEAAVDTWYRHWVAEGFHSLEEEARRASGDGRHMFGTEVTLADICLVPQMFNARRFKCNVEPFPRLRAICCAPRDATGLRPRSSKCAAGRELIFCAPVNSLPRSPAAADVGANAWRVNFPLH